MYVRSATHKAFGRGAWNWRFARSAGYRGSVPEPLPPQGGKMLPGP